MFLLVFALLAASTSASAQTTFPSTVQSQTIPRSTRSPGTVTDTKINFKQLAVAMAIVLGLIVALRYAAAWLMPGTRKGGTGRGVRVLGRTGIAPRQQVLLLHVGRRVLVVGDSAGTLSALANIDDPDEVAELVGQAGTAGTPAATTPSRFGTMFNRAEDPYNPSPQTLAAAEGPADADDPLADPAVAAARKDIAGLLDRMRALNKSVGR